MTAITVFNGLFCDSDPVVQKVLDITGFRLVTDQEIIADAALLSGLDKCQLGGVLTGGDLAEDGWDARRKAIPWLRYAVAKKLSEKQNILFWGYTSLLVPAEIENVLRVCLVSGMRARVSKGMRQHNLSEAEAREMIQVDDQARADWTVSVTNCNDPWATPLYDMEIPVGSTGIRQSAYLVVERLASVAVQDTIASHQEILDFLLAERVETTLAALGHELAVSVHSGAVRLRFVNHDKTFKIAARQLMEFVATFEGVRDVEIGLGSRYYQGDIYDRVQHPVTMVNRRSRLPRYIMLKPSSPCASERNAEDVELETCIQSTLRNKGYDVTVFVSDGVTSVTVDNHKKLLEVLGHGVVDMVAGIRGVESVEIGVGKEYHQAAMCRQVRRRIARTLVSAEGRGHQLFLSQRLRQHDTFALYDVKAASEKVGDGEPHVVVLDMPNLDDTAMVQQFKRDHPDTEVLILGGQEMDREACMNLGAFAYLHKPVDTALLNHTIQAANEKNRSYQSA
ncbi:cytidylate kinase family protein [Pseudodesulfovibrio sp.]|uniref:cytidylate kinase family protein n=1 Tax=unclassified Pseudodesulfovibrio TaxID=2661612 RepID=UPI003AFFDCF1